MEYLAVFLPSLGVGVIFYFVMRWLLRSDRAERTAQANSRADAESWYQQLREREGQDLPFGYEDKDIKPTRGLGLRNSIPIRDSTENKP